MNKLMELFLSFTNKSYTVSYKILSMIPGTIAFLVISPLFLFYCSRYLANLIPISFPRPFEVGIAVTALLAGIILMAWALFALWFDGEGTPAPIAPTRKLVTSGPYRYCRNPVELGTDLYFLFLGTWFDTLSTGILCMGLGMMLGYGYIKILEERELRLRFSQAYEEYYRATPLFLPFQFSPKKQAHD